jgi:hypothetical protein
MQPSPRWTASGRSPWLASVARAPTTLAALLAAFALGCVPATASHAQTAPPRLAVELTFPEKPRDRIRASLTITNLGPTSVRVVDPGYHAALSVFVFDHDWDQVVPDSIGKVHIAYAEVELASGAAAHFVIDDLAFTTATARVRFRLPPGLYHVGAIYHPGSSRLPAESVYPVVVASQLTTLLVE